MEYKPLSHALFAGVMQLAIASVELDSIYSVKSQVDTPHEFVTARDSLHRYLVIAIIWSMSIAVLQYMQFGFEGVIASTVANLVVILYIYYSYKTALNKTFSHNK